MESQENLLKSAGLPTTIDRPIDPRDILAQLKRDKKKRYDRIRWVLPRRIGEVFLADEVPSALVERVLHSMADAE